MAELLLLYWRDIPAQVVARAGRRRAKRVLSERFGQAIDACAMKVGARDSDAYLADWRKGTAQPCGEDLEAEAAAAAERIEQAYSNEHLKLLIDQGGGEIAAAGPPTTGPLTTGPATATAASSQT